jgi:leader peptidase (prepilin peptidase)/N-methyltransferase
MPIPLVESSLSDLLVDAWIALVIGWLAGSLVNYLADVLPTERRLSQATCSACQQPVPWHFYFYLRWVCVHCGRSSGIRFILVRVATWISAFWILLLPPARFDSSTGAWLGYLLLLYLILVIVIDIEHRLILHVTSLFAALLGLAVGVWLHGLAPTLVGGAAGLGLMWLVYYLGIGFVRLMGRIRRREIGEEAMGFGDVILAGVIGLMLGWPGILAGLVLTFVLGGVGSLIYLIAAALLRKYEINLTLPYGPFLALSVWILLFIL